MVNRGTVLIEEIPLKVLPVEVFEIFKDSQNSFFLDSGMDPSRLGRYSFIGIYPFLIFRSKGTNIEIIEGLNVYNERGNPLDILKDILNQYKLNFYSESLPFIGGAVGYFGYDLCHFIEDLPSRSIDDTKIWDCYLCFYTTILMFDNLRLKSYIITCNLPERNKEQSEETIDLLKNLSRNLSKVTLSKTPEKIEIDRPVITSNFTKDGYLEAVKRAKEYIAAGDIYQVNLSQRFCTDLYIEPWTLYKRLRTINPAPFAAYLNLEGLTIVSASPERFLKVKDGYIETRPIKGTRPRGRDKKEDEVLAQELLHSEKDKAEHIMIVDLERNDLGKICEYGSVKVSELEILETYATVFHLVSTVQGKLLPGLDWIDYLKACFPGGSVTGAPKIRSMEIIDELEPTKRGIYTGSIGYLSFNGEMDLNIVIRTFIIKDKKVYFQVGGAIVADSVPEREYDETLHKARALLKSLCGQWEIKSCITHA